MCILCLGNSSECFATKDRKELKENFPVIYVWLMSLRSYFCGEKRRIRSPFVTGGRGGIEEPATKQESPARSGSTCADEFRLDLFAGRQSRPRRRARSIQSIRALSNSFNASSLVGRSPANRGIPGCGPHSLAAASNSISASFKA